MLQVPTKVHGKLNKWQGLQELLYGAYWRKIWHSSYTKELWVKNECWLQSQAFGTLSRASSALSQWAQCTESLVHGTKKTFTVATHVNSQNDKSLFRSWQEDKRWSVLSYLPATAFQSKRHGFGRRFTDGQDKTCIPGAGCKNQQEILLWQPTGTLLGARHSTEVWPTQLDLAAGWRSLTHGWW